MSIPKHELSTLEEIEDADESRRHARQKMSRPVEFAASDGMRRAGVCRNLALGGMLIDTRDPAPFGAEVTIFIDLPGIGRSALRGVVRWAGHKRMGVQLGLMGARETHALLQLAGGT
jgi:hypothetical protein